jgi:hypothetical protein
LAGGRVTDEELRQEARERQQKSRAKKKLPKPEPQPEVRDSHGPTPIAQTPEVSAEERRAQNAALDAEPDEPALLPEPELMPGGQSAYYRDLFINACRNLLCRIEDESHQDEVIREWNRATKHWSGSKKAKAA